MTKPTNALTLPVRCNLSEAALEAALTELFYDPEITIMVSTHEESLFARRLAAKFPLSHVNVIRNLGYLSYEWSVTYRGVTVWNEGI